jgi:hypothetical protein
LHPLAKLEQNRYTITRTADVPAFIGDQGVISWLRIHCGS